MLSQNVGAVIENVGDFRGEITNNGKGIKILEPNPEFSQTESKTWCITASLSYLQKVVDNPRSTIVQRQINDSKVKMLVVVPGMEQRLITFIMTEDESTVYDLLELAQIPLTSDSKVYFVKHPILNINYIVETEKWTIIGPSKIISDQFSLAEISTVCGTMGLRNIQDGMMEKTHTLLLCRMFRIGSYRCTPRKNLLINEEGFTFEVPLPHDKTTYVTIHLELRDIAKLLVYSKKITPVLYLNTNMKTAEKIRNILGMKNGEGPYFDPAGSDRTHKRIVIMPKKFPEDTKLVLKRLLESKYKTFGLIAQRTKAALIQASKENLPQPEITIKREIQPESTNQFIAIASTSKMEVCLPPPVGVITIKSEDDEKNIDYPMMEKNHISWHCKSMKIGACIFIPRGNIMIDETGFKFQVTLPQDDSMSATIHLKLVDIAKLYTYHFESTSLLLLYVNAMAGALIQETIGIQNEDPAGNNHAERFIFFMDNIAGDSKLIFEYLLKPNNILEELSAEEAYIFLLQSLAETPALANALTEQTKTENTEHLAFHNTLEKAEDFSTDSTGYEIVMKTEDATLSEDQTETENTEHLAFHNTLGTAEDFSTNSAGYEIVMKTEDATSSEDQYDEISRTIMKIQNEKGYISLCCQLIKIGSYGFVPRKKVLINEMGFTMEIPLQDNSMSAMIPFNFEDIIKVLVYHAESMSVLFLHTNTMTGRFIRKFLGMQDGRDPYFDPAANDQTQRRIILFSNKLSDEAQLVLNRLLKPDNILEELDTDQATDILLQASPENFPYMQMILRGFTQPETVKRSTVHNTVEKMSDDPGTSVDKELVIKRKIHGYDAIVFETMNDVESEIQNADVFECERLE